MIGGRSLAAIRWAADGASTDGSTANPTREGTVMRLRIIPLLVIVAAILWSVAAFAAIAPSKLGRFVSREWNSDDALLRSLRDAGLVRPDVPDDKLMAEFKRARQEDAALSEGQRPFNSPEERVRVFLEPYLTDKGRRWAVPLDSLDLPDD